MHDQAMLYFKGNQRKADEEFEEFFLENYHRVMFFSLRILMSEEDAEDITQDIFLKLINMPQIWREKDKLKRDGYLFKMTKNHIFNFIKHRKVERKYHGELIKNSLISHEFNLDGNIDAKGIELLVTHTVEQMPVQRKTIFKMSRYENMSNLQIAESLELSPRTVERHLYLALLDLKKVLSDYQSVE